MITKKLLILGATIFALSSCASRETIHNQTLDYTMLMPSGAPTLPLYYEILKEEVEVTTTPTDIPVQFNTSEYDYLVFDSTKATNFTNKDDAKYSFKMMLTGGNFHVLGFDKEKDSVPQEGEYILSFQKDSTSDKAFKNVFGDIIPATNYFDAINVLQTHLTTMDGNFEISGTKIDWTVVSEPQRTNLMNIWAKNGIDTSKIIDIDLQKAFKEHNPTYEFDYIPQAALYVNKEYEAEHPEQVEKLITRVQESVTNVIENPNDVAKAIEESEIGTDTTAQTAQFGFTTEIMKEVQKDGKNGFGIVPSKDDLDLKFDDGAVKLFNTITTPITN